MILPFFLDRVPERLGTLYAKLTKWCPEGQGIELTIDEAGDPSLKKKVLQGRILKIGKVPPPAKKDQAQVQSQCAVVKLEVPLRHNGRQTEFVLAQPRFLGHGFFRLPITWNVVHLFPLDRPAIPDVVPWEDMIAICCMKLSTLKR